MNIKRRSFLALMAASVPAFLAACGAAPTPTSLPQPATPGFGPQLPAGEGARVRVDRTEIDVGTVKFETMVNAVFTVTNDGTAPLTLQVPATVRAEAGC